MNRILSWMLLAALAGCQGSASDGEASNGSSTETNSPPVPSPGSESPPILFASDEEPVDTFAERAAEVKTRFDKQVGPLLVKHCVRCHGEKKVESGIRIDRLDGGLDERWLPLWKGVRRNVVEETMPPEDEPQPTAQERALLDEW
ncbi:MAG: c-type cytochrome domain-containing protein, partial [Planctomycetaceae bacterium]